MAKEIVFNIDVMLAKRKMSVTALSLPSMIMLSKAVKPKLLFWFIFIVVVGVMIIGFAFNALNFLFV